jgi:hypothetical protein
MFNLPTRAAGNRTFPHFWVSTPPSRKPRNSSSPTSIASAAVLSAHPEAGPPPLCAVLLHELRRVDAPLADDGLLALPALRLVVGADSGTSRSVSTGREEGRGSGGAPAWTRGGLVPIAAVRDLPIPRTRCCSYGPFLLEVEFRCLLTDNSSFELQQSDVASPSAAPLSRAPAR